MSIILQRIVQTLMAAPPAICEDDTLYETRGQAQFCKRELENDPKHKGRHEIIQVKFAPGKDCDRPEYMYLLRHYDEKPKSPEKPKKPEPDKRPKVSYVTPHRLWRS